MGPKTIYPNWDRPNFIEKELKARMAVSHDLEELRKKDYHLVFVYGTIKEGFHNNRILNSEALFLGTARTENEHYDLKSNGSFPVAFLNHSGEGNHIYGEVFAVTPDNFLDLDWLESNGTMYHRVTQRIRLLDQDTKSVVDSFMYVGDKDYWQDGRLTNLVPKLPGKGPLGLFWEKTYHGG